MITDGQDIDDDAMAFLSSNQISGIDKLQLGSLLIIRV
jgi:hypothetical protein